MGESIVKKYLDDRHGNVEGIVFESHLLGNDFLGGVFLSCSNGQGINTRRAQHSIFNYHAMLPCRLVQNVFLKHNLTEHIGDNYLNISGFFQKILGYGEAEMIGKSLFDFMDETGLKIANENIINIIDSQ